MQLTQQKVSDTAQRVRAFLDSQSAAIGTTVPAPLRAKLDAAATQLSGAQVDQETLAKAVAAEVAKQNALRKEVKVDFLIPIGRIVRRAFKTSPDYQAMIVPTGLTRKGDFLGKVTAATAAAATHAQDLIDHGLPADFIAQMQTAVAQLAASVETRGKQVGLKQQTVKALKDSSKAIRDVLHIIDGNMRRALKKNQPLLTNWIATKRIQATVVTPLPNGDLNAAPSAVPTPAPVVPAPVVPTAPAKPAA
jgi:hypothetical protein